MNECPQDGSHIALKHSAEYATLFCPSVPGELPLGGETEARWIPCWQRSAGCKLRLAIKWFKVVTKECLMDAVLHPINLQDAQETIRRNKGCAGIDGKSIA